MNHKILLTLVSLTASLALPSRVLAQSLEELPLEVVNYRIAQGTNSVGIPLLRPALWRGKIASVSSSTRVITDQDTKSSGPVLAQIPLEPAYLEITASALDPKLVGERFEVGVVETRGPLGTKGQIRLISSSWDTRPDVPAGLAGCSYEIHPHWTLSAFLGTPDKAPLRRAKSIASADSVRIPSITLSGKWDSFFIVEDKNIVGWRSGQLRGGPDAGGAVIPPGVGVQIVVQAPIGAEKPIVLMGEARKHAFRRPLQVGKNLISLGHPRPHSLSLILANRDYGFQAGSNSANSDEIQFRNHARWEVLRYVQGFSGSADQPSWQCLTARYGGKLENLPLLPANQAFWIQKVQPDSDFIIPPPTP
jgi:hypothetical protein